MQKQQQQQGFDWVEAQKRNWNLIVFALAVWQRAIVVPMRHRFGVEALGSICVASFLFMAVWAWCWHDPLMWAYLGYWTLCVLQRRAEARRLVRKGERIHSLADGWPREAMRFPFVRTQNTAKLRIEPLNAFGCGLVVLGLARWLNTPPGLACFLMAGSIPMNAIETMRQRIWRRRTQAILDARLEQEAVMQSYRDRWGSS